MFKILKLIIKKNNEISFDGWGLVTTSTNPPWEQDNNTSKIFNVIHSKILDDIKKKKFIDTTKGNDIHDSVETLEGLKWRHYIIYISVNLVWDINNKKNFVECGVGDGLSISYVLNQITNKNSKFYLYDSWSEMKKEYLFTKKEYKNIGSYESLNFDVTKANLERYRNNIIYNRGYIPEVFKSSVNPSIISWLHIDLNSSIPTLRSLEFFYDRLEINGIIIFDDYGWKGYEDTREIIDNFLGIKKGTFFQFPTGQGLFIKK
jgi:hypothetical protein